jgi:hypothetical protein
MSIVRATQQQEAADQEWAAAFAAHEQVEPELIPFAERLRNTSVAASHRAEALEYALRAGITELMPDPIRRHPPRELSPGANRPGPERSWIEFDEAIMALQDAEQGTNVADLARSLRDFASITKFLADTVDEIAEERRRNAASATTEHPADRRAIGA